MVGSKDLPPSQVPFRSVFYQNQFKAKPQWPAPGTDLGGRTAIITGANTGLGYEAAHQLLSLGLSRLIMGARSPQRGEAAAKEFRKQFPKASVEVWQVDLASYKSVQAFVERVDEQLQRIDYVLLNAAMMHLNFVKSEETGHEDGYQVNYLSTMLMALLLLPILKAKGPPGEPPHLTIVSAALTLAAKFPNRNEVPLLPSFDDQKHFDPQETYHSTKLLAHMMLWKLVDYIKADEVIVNLADPAWCRGTSLARDVTNPVVKMFLYLFGLLGRTPKVGASCFVDAMVNKGKESHGCFLMSWKIHPFSAILYTEEGKQLTERVWNETLDEFSFANVRSILETLKTQ